MNLIISIRYEYNIKMITYDFLRREYYGYFLFKSKEKYRNMTQHDYGHDYSDIGDTIITLFEGGDSARSRIAWISGKFCQV